METFDTHDLYNDFNKAGVPAAHAEVFLKALKKSRAGENTKMRSIERDIADIKKNTITKEERKELATKADIELVRGELKSESKEIRTEFRAAISEVKATISEAKATLIQYIIGLIFAMIGSMAALVGILKFFF